MSECHSPEVDGSYYATHCDGYHINPNNIWYLKFVDDTDQAPDIA